MPGFFSAIDNHWGSYQALRRKYADGVTVPQKNYFQPIRSIDDMAELAIRPIAKPLWLAVHTLGFLIKAIINLALTLILTPCALILNLLAPNSDLTESTNSTFKLAAAQTVVGVGMAAVALFSAAMALIFNLLHVLTRVASTVIDRINETTESCCGLTIARL